MYDVFRSSYFSNSGLYSSTTEETDGSDTKSVSSTDSETTAESGEETTDDGSSASSTVDGGTDTEITATSEGDFETTATENNVTIDQEQFNLIMESLEHNQTLVAEVQAYLNFGFMVLIPLIAIVCLLWWFCKQFLNRFSV